MSLPETRADHGSGKTKKERAPTADDPERDAKLQALRVAAERYAEADHLLEEACGKIAGP